MAFRSSLFDMGTGSQNQRRKPGVAFHPSTQRQRQLDPCEFETSLDLQSKLKDNHDFIERPVLKKKKWKVRV